MNTNHPWISSEAITVKVPKASKWRCYLFGGSPNASGAYIFRPVEGQEPNFFWRWMQYLAFGNLWVKDQ